MADRFLLTVLLAVLVWGAGHIYLGLVNRGMIILVTGVVLAFVTPWFIPIPASWIIIIGYWAWQIWDAYKHYKQLNALQPEVSKSDIFQ